MADWRPFLLVPAVLAAPQWASAKQYLTTEQAQQVIFPGIPFKALSVRLSDDQRRVIEQRSGVRVRVADLRAWRAPDGAVFVVDEVLGKHEMITYALGIRPDGTVQGIEVLEYRESYGHEIRNPEWRAQFTGRDATASLKLDADIRNIGGATLSCKHVVEGVRRLLATHDIALR